MKADSALSLLDKPHYKYWQALYLAFFSPKLYVDVGKRWKGLGILYLLLLCFVFSPLFSYNQAIKFNAYFNQELIDPIKQLPLLYVQKGVLSLDKPQPYLIKNQAGKVVIIIDTTGQVTHIDGRYPDLFMLFTQDRFIYKPPKLPAYFGDISVMDSTPTEERFTADMTQVFDVKAWVEASGLNYLRFFVAVILYLAIAVFLFTLLLSLYLVFAMLSQLLAKYSFKIDLSYSQSTRLLIVSATPQVLFLFWALGFGAPFSGFGYALIALLAAYFSFAVISLKRESHRLVRL